MAGTGPIADEPPSRALIRLAGVLTQLAGACCLLIGTIAFVLVQQNKAGGAGLVIAWVAGAMAGLVVGGLVYRGSTISLALGALVDAGFGIALLALGFDALRKLLRILPESDVQTIGQALNGLGIAMLLAAALCLVAIPQGRAYARWLAEASLPSSPVSTARGFPPPPVPARRTTMIIVPDANPAARRRAYIALGGLAIGVGAGVGVLVSSTAQKHGAEAAVATTTGSAAANKPGDPKAGDAKPSATPFAADAGGAAPSDAAPAPAPDDAVGSAGSAVPPADDSQVLQHLVLAERAAIAKNDAHALSLLVAPTAFAFGAGPAALAEGRAAIEAQLRADLGESPPDGFAVESKFLAIGQERDHAWIAEDLQVGSRRITLSQLVARTGDGWTIVALHWGVPLADATAERMAILGTLPAPAPVPNKVDAPADVNAAIRKVFESRAAFADAIATRADSFNFGSAPGEHIRGGDALKKIFGRMRAELRLHDGARVVAVSPAVAFAAVNVDFTTKTRAQTDVTQTFRVLAVFVRAGAGWKIVQSHFSNAGSPP